MPNLELKIDKNIFNDFYYPYLMDYSHRFECHKGSAGSGKSMWISQKLFLKALNMPNRRILVMRKVGASIKDSTWQLFIDILHQFKMYDRCKVNKSDFTITLPNNSVFLFKGLDDPEKIKSIIVTDIFVEEATEFDLDSITQLNLRLRAKVPFTQMYFAFNPVNKSNFCFSFFKFSNENQTQPIREYDDTIVFCTTYKNNKFLSDDYIKTLEAMKETNYLYYQIYVLGLFCSTDKIVYNNWKVIDFDYKKLKKENPDMVAIFGMDFGYVTDASTLVASLVNEDKKEIYIFFEFYQKGMLNNELAQMIKDNGFAKEVIIADSAERKSIDEIKKLGVPRIKPARKGKGSILQGVQKLLQYKIYVHPSCINTIEELSNYSYKKDKQTNEYKNNEINDEYNHILDGLRYSLQALKAKPKLIKIRL